MILALGRTGTPRKLGVPGEDLGKVMYRLIEADHYVNKNVLVVGGGDSAVDGSGIEHPSVAHRTVLLYVEKPESRFDFLSSTGRQVTREAAGGQQPGHTQ